MTVLAAQRWQHNGHLIKAVADLHILPRFPAPQVMDVTYGRGIWWKCWRPEGLIAHDLYTLDGVDFRALPEADESVDVVAFDAPYVSVGGRETTTIRDMHDRFGLHDAPNSPAGVQTLINDGLDEVHRVTRRGGLALVKCADYVSSGKLWAGSFFTLQHALQGDQTLVLDANRADPRWSLIDKLDMIGSARPQPTSTKCRYCIAGLAEHWSNELQEAFTMACERCDGAGRIPRRQQHARQNRSTLYVLQRL